MNGYNVTRICYRATVALLLLLVTDFAPAPALAGAVGLDDFPPLAAPPDGCPPGFPCAPKGGGANATISRKLGGNDNEYFAVGNGTVRANGTLTIQKEQILTIPDPGPCLPLGDKACNYKSFVSVSPSDGTVNFGTLNAFNRLVGGLMNEGSVHAQGEIYGNIRNDANGAFTVKGDLFSRSEAPSNEVTFTNTGSASLLVVAGDYRGLTALSNTSTARDAVVVSNNQRLEIYGLVTNGAGSTIRITNGGVVASSELSNAGRIALGPGGRILVGGDFQFESADSVLEFVFLDGEPTILSEVAGDLIAAEGFTLRLVFAYPDGQQGARAPKAGDVFDLLKIGGAFNIDESLIRVISDDAEDFRFSLKFQNGVLSAVASEIPIVGGFPLIVTGIGFLSLSSIRRRVIPRKSLS